MGPSRARAEQGHPKAREYGDGGRLHGKSLLNLAKSR